MSNTLEIPRYKVLIPNSTYGRKTEPVTHPISKEKVPATQILQLLRYTIPSKDDIINLIQSAVRSFNPLSKAEKNQQESSLDKFIKMFSIDEIKKIQDGEKEALSHLRKHCITEGYQTGRAYLQCTNGVIPNKILTLEDRAIREEGAIIYEELINKLGIKTWYLKVRLNDKDNFPSSLELGYLLDRGVRNCDIFSLEGDYDDYQTVVNQLKLLGNVFDSSANVRKVLDSSDVFLKSRAAITIEEAATCLFDDRILSRGLTKIISETIKNFSSKPSQSGWVKYLGPNIDPSTGSSLN